MLISAKEYAEKHGYKPATVKQWCYEGNLPGAQKMHTGKSGLSAWKYMIPEDAKPVRPLRKYQKAYEKVEEENPELVKPLPALRTRHDKCDHIRKHCSTRTYKQLMDETGMKHEEIREVYDQLHEVYGI